MVVCAAVLGNEHRLENSQQAVLRGLSWPRCEQTERCVWESHRCPGLLPPGPGPTLREGHGQTGGSLARRDPLGTLGPGLPGGPGSGDRRAQMRRGAHVSYAQSGVRKSLLYTKLTLGPGAGAEVGRLLMPRRPSSPDSPPATSDQQGWSQPKPDALGWRRGHS